MNRQRQELGQSGEELATQFLLKKGYRILARNLKNRYGEIDILAQHNRTVVLV
jgi:putative endonuclease